MATGAPNAILAINSLDRYITTSAQPVLSFFYAAWANGATTIILENSPIPGASTPQVGALVAATSVGLSARIVSIGPTPNQINISTPTTQAQALGFQVTQVTTAPAGASQPVSTALYGAFQDVSPFANDFNIQSPNALINGYIQRIVVSQIQVQYNIPTVNQNLNDTFYIYSSTAGDFYQITIPFGFYTPDELAAVMQIVIRATTSDLGQPPITDMLVTFDSILGFKFNSVTNEFDFPDPVLLKGQLNLSDALINNIYKTYKMLGIGLFNTGLPRNTQFSFNYPNFLYTPYIDIFSDVLTNYQNIKDTNTSIAKPKGLIARVYLSGTGNVQTTTSSSALGSAPFTMTADLNSPKIIKWTPDVAVPTIDFQLRDCYGDLIPGAADGYSTEWQMTLLCVEGREWNS
jgi:hypothetical protein